MPGNKKNRRKEIQKAKRDAQPKPKCAIIAHTPHGGSGAALAMALAQAFPSIVDVDVLKQKEGD